MPHEETCNCKDGACECEDRRNCSCSCECCRGNGHFMRRYHTKAEQVEKLEVYLAELKEEVQAVEEHLADLQRA